MGAEWKGPSKPLHQGHSKTQCIQNKSQHPKFHTEPGVKVLGEGNSTETVGRPPAVVIATGLGALLGPREPPGSHGGPVTMLPPPPQGQGNDPAGSRLSTCLHRVRWSVRRRVLRPILTCGLSLGC